MKYYSKTQINFMNITGIPNKVTVFVKTLLNQASNGIQ